MRFKFTQATVFIWEGITCLEICLKKLFSKNLRHHDPTMPTSKLWEDKLNICIAQELICISEQSFAKETADSRAQDLPVFKFTRYK